MEREFHQSFPQDIWRISTPSWNCVFDSSDSYLLYPSLFGIKVVDMYTNRVIQVIGNSENHQRFVSIALFQGIASSSVDQAASTLMKSGLLTSSASSIAKQVEDPIAFVTGYHQNRLYLFSNRVPIETYVFPNTILFFHLLIRFII